MLITAHGGAMGTGRNSHRYFNEIYKYDIDIIEVDVRKRGNRLYISHLKALFSGRAIQLSFVFEYVVKHNLKVNCDLKDRGIIGEVIALAAKYNALPNLVFTGSIYRKDLPMITAGEVYVNTGYYFPLTPNVNNLSKIKSILDSSNNKHIAGINIPYRYATDEFIIKAKELNVPLSIYTVDKPDVLRRILSHKVANVTTNIVSIALEIIKEQGK